jgi:ankyrin repeat protein
MNGDFVDVKVDATFSEQGFTALHYAAKANAPVSLIRSIVNRGADVNAHTSICEEREQDEY